MKKKFGVILLVGVSLLLIGVIVLFDLFKGFSGKPVVWQGAQTNFSISYFTTSVDKSIPSSISIYLKNDGNFESKRVEGNRVINQRVGKLSDKEMEEVFNYVIKENKFFNVKQPTNEVPVADLGPLSLTITLGEEEHSISGIAVFDNKTCEKVMDKLTELENKFPLQDFGDFRTQIEKEKKVNDKKIDELLQAAKAEYIAGKNIPVVVFAGLINKKYIPENSKLKITKENTDKMKFQDHPTQKISGQVYDRILEKGYLSNEEPYLLTLLKDDSKYGIIADWYTKGTIPDNYTLEAYRMIK